MNNDSNSLKKDLTIINNKNNNRNNTSKNTWSIILISIIIIVSLLNFAILGFIILNSQDLLNKFDFLNHNRNNQLPKKYDIQEKREIKEKLETQDNATDRKLSQYLSEREYFKDNITNIWVKINEFDKYLKKEFQDYKELENKILNDYQYVWIINEIDYIINLIATQIILNGNINSAVEALQMLDSRLAILNSSEIISLRKAISQDLFKIIQYNYADITSASLEINLISSIIDNLPYYSYEMLNKKNVTGNITKDNANTLTWYGKIWEDIKNSATNLVKVRKIKGDLSQFISPDQSFFIKENMKLKLQDARVALLYRNQGIYNNDLNSVRNYTNKYFDISMQSVQNFNKKLGKLLVLNIQAPKLADVLGNTLKIMRNLKGNNYHDQLTKKITSININKASDFQSDAIEYSNNVEQTKPKQDVPNSNNVEQTKLKQDVSNNVSNNVSNDVEQTKLKQDVLNSNDAILPKEPKISDQKNIINGNSNTKIIKRKLKKNLF